MEKRKICYITGTRADYGLMKSTLGKIAKEFDLCLIVVGMHLSSDFGNTVKDIEQDGFKIVKKIKSFSNKDSRGNMAKSVGLYIIKITEALESLKPDILLVLGDRGEALAGAIVGAHMGIAVIHIHGGDQGDDGAHIDDLTRHAITKFAHIHLAATKNSASRILKMGEEPWRVYLVGSPGLDDIILRDLFSKEYIARKYNLNLKKSLFLVVQHSTPGQATEAEQQIRATMEALKELNEQTVLIHPSSDAGGRKMIKIIKQYEKFAFLRVFKSLPRKDYLSIMKYSSLMVGNSSSGTIDAPSFKLPVVNIGTRESIREHAGNKIFVGHSKKEIIMAIKKALSDEEFMRILKKCKNPYGDGRTGKRIVNILANLKINNKLLTKKLTY